MAGRGFSRMRSQPSSRRFMKVLASAFFEWLLIAMLFIQAILAYLITTFARYCELPIPCLLCSRLDHLLGNERAAGLYWDLMCRKHKSEISSLVLCNVHDKLVDVHGICETCLFSFATKDKSNSETYRLLVGKLGTHPNIDVADSLLLDDDDQNPNSTAEKLCCCCEKPWTSRGHVQFILQPKSTEILNAEFDAPLTREIKQHVDADTKTNRPYKFVPSSFEQGNVNDPLRQFEYCELKISSDTESDIPLSDAEDLNTLEQETHCSLKDQIVDVAQVDTQNTKGVYESVSWVHIDQDQIVDVSQVDTQNSKVVDGSLSAVHIDRDQIVDVAQVDTQKTKVVDDSISSIHCNLNQALDVSEVDTQNTKMVDESVSAFHIDLDEPLKLINEVQCDMVDMHEVLPSVTPTAIGHGLEELSWQQIDLRDEPDSSPDLINTNDVPPLGDADKPVHYKGIIEEEHEQIPADEIRKEVDEAQMVHVTSDSAGSKINTDVTEGRIPSPNSLDLGTAYKLAISNKGRQLSGKLLEQLAVKDSRTSEDLKLLLTQLSAAARGLDSPVSAIVSPRLSGNLEGLRISDSSAKVSPRLSGNLECLRMSDSSAKVSPRLSANLEGLRISDSSVSAGLQILQSRISLDRNDSRNSLERGESGFESVTFSIVSEIEGESELEQLKRQIEHDKNVLGSLLKELEEERNASAVAANQAMAMINKLQEEKATLQMEALHNIRMMEEQAEYDIHALEEANDLLAEKDKEIQDLEAELDYYRIKYPHELDFENEEENTASGQSHHLEGQDNVSNSSGNIVDSSEEIQKSAMECKNSISRSSCLDFEDERMYILKCLIDLEKKLHMFSDDGAYSDSNDQGRRLETVERKLAESEEGSQSKDEIKDGSEVRNDNDVLSISSGNLKCGETDLVALGYTVSCLSERLQALEMDKKFLDHTINSLRNGEEGFCFIKEIASHLRALRSMAIKRNQISP